MCIFCAAIPASLAVGASARARETRERIEAEETGKPVPRAVVPAGPATAAVVTALVIGSVIVHTRLLV